MAPMKVAITRLGALVMTALLAVLVAACSSGPAAEGPAGVVKTALDKVAAKDIEGLRTLACAGQEDRIREQLGIPAAVASDLVPGLETQGLLDAVQLDVAKVKLGDAVVTGDTATVPVKGDVGVTFDAAKMRPIVRKLLASRGTTATDEQVDALIKGLAAYGQAVPVDESIRLVRENGAWKICQETITP